MDSGWGSLSAHNCSPEGRGGYNDLVTYRQMISNYRQTLTERPQNMSLFIIIISLIISLVSCGCISHKQCRLAAGFDFFPTHACNMSLISLVFSVDVKHHVYSLTYGHCLFCQCCLSVTTFCSTDVVPDIQSLLTADVITGALSY